MDSNDISINALVRDSGLCSDFEWCNNSTFSCRWQGFELEADMAEKNIVVRDIESSTKLTFRHVWPRTFDAFLEDLRWDFEEEEAA